MDHVAPRPRLFTIGHSNRSMEDFLALLARHGVTVVADVRSRPYSKHAPQFNKEQIQRAVQSAGIQYVFLGRELGGQPKGEDFYDRAGHVLYWKIAESPGFRKGVERLRSGIGRGFTISLMCGEEDPAQCHRHLLLGKVLHEQGIEVLHILADGGCASEADMQAEENKIVRQHSLFGNDERVQWKSTQSVSPRNPQPSSSHP